MWGPGSKVSPVANPVIGIAGGVVRDRMVRLYLDLLVTLWVWAHGEWYGCQRFASLATASFYLQYWETDSSLHLLGTLKGIP
jgi:hypothetical protein